MKGVSNMKAALLITLLFCFQQVGKAQVTSAKLKKEQERLESKISSTKSLLNQTKSHTEASLNELKIIDNQIRFREELVSNFDNQIRTADVQMTKKDQQIRELEAKISKLKIQYKKLLLYAYKHRNKYGKMMYIFSSGSYYEAIKRNKYLEKISDIQKKQHLIIQQHQHLIKEEIHSIQEEKSHKLVVLEEKKKEKESILKDKEKQQEVYKTFKSKEKELMEELHDEERQKERLKERINEAIRKEIAEAEKKAAKERAEAEAKRKAAAAAAEAKRIAKAKADAAAKAKANANAPAMAPTVEKPVEEPIAEPVAEVEEVNLFETTKEAAALGFNFESSKGKLPWPVDKGTITEGFGKNAHPTLDNVYTNNSGIDISTPKGAQVRAVFEGEVTSILNIPGAGKVVIIKHGNYRTVYSNLQDTYVTKGAKVKIKQSIGSLLVDKNSSVSVAHFEIHQVVGSSVQTINPTLWVTH